ncbi:RNA polymerase sigma factor SigF [Halomicronema hongdechloris C2206]|uniref:RNA polymerase sigma factor SigF n=1 Tax=Halomicronema hongdechloris C2206 TaxID=1641165 RepID=A0A1Z3HMX9_9CYAN|nr:sigma-70 family RNA polymerase sigma factor [Halomicronema hongdechloris]ASC71658.1 RNA polymerase sigma factor SigF [Halomicronema hongdechloris C2206]
MAPPLPPDLTSPDPSCDRTLVIRLYAGQAEVLGKLYDRYASLVYTLALKMLGNAEEAEDLTQEVFITLWQQQKYDPDRGSLGSYLATYTRSRALDRLRVQGNRRRIVQQFRGVLAKNSQPPTQPLDQASQQEQGQQLRSALAQLPATEREVLEIAYFEGLSQSQMAARLNLPLGTVKTRCRQGLRRLRMLLHQG